MRSFLVVTALALSGAFHGAAKATTIEESADAVAEKVIAWRQDLHANPELGNREFRTARIVADHLRSLSFDRVETEVAHTGVVGVLRGGKPGPVVALRADMDALPVTEQTGLPFASTVTTEWRGQQTGVMHACGHDAHTAILMGVAEVLAGMREDIPGSVKFIFQPAEEGAPPGEEGGAELMVAQGVLRGDYAPGAIFGLHVAPFRAGSIGYRPGGMQAASDGLKIVIKGQQTHGAMPWAGVDPIVVAAQVISGVQSVVSRQIDITKAPAIITFGSINGGKSRQYHSRASGTHRNHSRIRSSYAERYSRARNSNCKPDGRKSRGYGRSDHRSWLSRDSKRPRTDREYEPRVWIDMRLGGRPGLFHRLPLRRTFPITPMKFPACFSHWELPRRAEA